MSTIFRRKSCDRVLLDLNTQCDYLLPKGAVPVANRAEIIPNIRRLFEWARQHAVPVISSLDAHRSDEHTNGFPKHCIDRTPGQRKLPFTLLPRRILLDGDNTLDLPPDVLTRYRQVIFAKRTRDLLGNPKADRLLTEMTVTHQIVFGVMSEHCIKATVLALLTRQRNVIVIKDACGHWNAPDGDLAMRQMEAKGAFLVTTEQIVNFETLPVRILAPVAVDGDAARAMHGGKPVGTNGNGAAHPNGNGNGHANPETELSKLSIQARIAASRQAAASKISKLLA